MHTKTAIFIAERMLNPDPANAPKTFQAQRNPKQAGGNRLFSVKTLSDRRSIVECHGIGYTMLKVQLRHQTTSESATDFSAFDDLKTDLKVFAERVEAASASLGGIVAVDDRTQFGAEGSSGADALGFVVLRGAMVAVEHAFVELRPLLEFYRDQVVYEAGLL